MALQPRQCASSSSSTIHLDHGADSASFDPRDLRVSARGLSLPSRWRFEPGAEVAVNFQLDEGMPGPLPPTLRTTGMVVDCEPDPCRDGVFWLTLIFLESTDDVLTLVQALADYRARLAVKGTPTAPKAPPALENFSKLKLKKPSFEL